MKIITYKNIEQENVDFINNAKGDLYVTASRAVIKKWVKKIDEKISKNRRLKHYFMWNHDEFASGTFLYSHCMLSAVKSIYLMFDYIKSDESEKAWMSLIDTYDYLDVATLFLDKYKLHSEGLEAFIEQVKGFENIFFPTHHLFLSPGAKETAGNCSICGGSFISCEHVEREIYNGMLCQRINRHVLEANHIALVDNPRDRRCIIRTITNTDGSKLNIFSRERTAGNENESEHMTINAVLYSYERPVFD